jgi:hypothetical protein
LAMLNYPTTLLSLLVHPQFHYQVLPTVTFWQLQDWTSANWGAAHWRGLKAQQLHTKVDCPLLLTVFKQLQLEMGRVWVRKVASLTFLVRITVALVVLLTLTVSLKDSTLVWVPVGHWHLRLALFPIGSHVQLLWLLWPKLQTGPAGISWAETEGRQHLQFWVVFVTFTQAQPFEVSSFKSL